MDVKEEEGGLLPVEVPTVATTSPPLCELNSVTTLQPVHLNRHILTELPAQMHIKESTQTDPSQLVHVTQLPPAELHPMTLQGQVAGASPLDTPPGAPPGPVETPRERRRRASPWKYEPIQLRPCEVCGERATGFHFGVISCEACKVIHPLTVPCRSFHCVPKENSQRMTH